jgi:hypothetical protein
MVTSNPDQIQTRYIPNTTFERYWFSNVVDKLNFTSNKKDIIMTRTTEFLFSIFLHKHYFYFSLQCSWMTMLLAFVIILIKILLSAFLLCFICLSKKHRNTNYPVVSLQAEHHKFFCHSCCNNFDKIQNSKNRTQISYSSVGPLKVTQAFINGKFLYN